MDGMGYNVVYEIQQSLQDFIPNKSPKQPGPLFSLLIGGV